MQHRRFVIASLRGVKRRSNLILSAWFILGICVLCLYPNVSFAKYKTGSVSSYGVILGAIEQSNRKNQTERLYAALKKDGQKNCCKMGVIQIVNRFGAAKPEVVATVWATDPALWAKNPRRVASKTFELWSSQKYGTRKKVWVQMAKGKPAFLHLQQKVGKKKAVTRKIRWPNLRVDWQSGYSVPMKIGDPTKKGTALAVLFGHDYRKAKVERMMVEKQRWGTGKITINLVWPSSNYVVRLNEGSGRRWAKKARDGQVEFWKRSDVNGIRRFVGVLSRDKIQKVIMEIQLTGDKKQTKEVAINF